MTAIRIGPLDRWKPRLAFSCAPLPDGEASVEYLRHLVFLHARQALRDAFARAS